jgi:hypothetical protein
MKSNIKTFVIILALIITSVVFSGKTSAQQPYVSIQVFYDQLSPYGEWVDYPNYGYVWIPDAGPDFVPYSTQGHWILTDYGWTWLSNYPWGWAPFHYGRWDYDQYYGWFWIPDTQWGPAWVSWRRAEGYYGWEPLGPGISLSVSFGRGYDSRNDHWIFVRDRDFDRSDINLYYVNRTDHDMIIRQSTVISNTYVDQRRNTTYVTGPARADIQKVTGRRVDPVVIQENSKPGQDLNNGRLTIYRPQVTKNNERGHSAAPSRITNLKDVRQPAERKVTNQPRDLNVKSTQPVNANPAQNVRRVEQPNNVKPQNSNPSKNVRKVEQPDNIKPKNTNPPQNVRKEVNQNDVKPQNSNPPQNVRKEVNQNDVKPQSSNPPQNVRREVQQNNVKQQDIKQSGNTRKDQQSNANAKQSKNNKKEQQKKSNPEKEKKENN